MQNTVILDILCPQEAYNPVRETKATYVNKFSTIIQKRSIYNQEITGKVVKKVI